MVDINTTDPNLLIPDKSILYEIAGASYTDDYQGDIDGFSLLKQSPTLKFFKKKDYPVIVVGVRGTADFEDLKAWLPVVFNTIVETDRYSKDTQDLLRFQANYRPTEYYYYATGHSLAGVIIDEWLKQGFIIGARTYNPAIQLKDLPNASINNYRVYASGDPLYKLFGSRTKKAPEVRQSSTFLDIRSPFAVSPALLWSKGLLAEHTWRNPLFKGGKYYVPF